MHCVSPGADAHATVGPRSLRCPEPLVYWGMRLELRPPREVAGVALGSSRADAVARCSVWGSLGSSAGPRKSRHPSRCTGRVDWRCSCTSTPPIGRRRSSSADLTTTRMSSSSETSSAPWRMSWSESLKDSDVVEVAEQGRAVTLPDLLVALWRCGARSSWKTPLTRWVATSSPVLVVRSGYYN
jgi:hypothetical protein